MMKKGLVLEGGGLRGIFTAGVMDVLMEEGVKFDGAVGVSAGAAFGSNYKSGQNRRGIRYNLRFARDPRYSSLRSLISTGNLFNAQFCYHDIPEKLDPFDWEAFRKNPMEFYLVCTDVRTGKPVYHKCEEDEEEWEMLEWFRASGSMPLVSRVVEIGEHRLLDGGISDSIPLKFMEEQGYDRNLVILTRPAGYVKRPNTMMPVIRRVLRAYPDCVEAIENRHIAYNEELSYVRKREAGGYAFVIRPERDLDVGRIEHDRYKIRAAYKEGRKMARRHLPEILRFLSGTGAAAGITKPSMIEEDLIVTDTVRPSLVKDSTLISSVSENDEAVEKAGFVKDESAESADFVKEESAESADFIKEEKEETAGSADIAKDESAESAVFTEDEAAEKTAGTTGSAIAEEADNDAGLKAVEQESGQMTHPASGQDSKPVKKWAKEVRSILLEEPEEELPAFQRPFPAGRMPDTVPGSAEEEIEVKPAAVESSEEQAAVEVAEEPAAEQIEQAAAAEQVPEEPSSSMEPADDSPEDQKICSESVTAQAFAEADNTPSSRYNRKRGQKRKWKPGEMNSLKKKDS